MRRFLYVCISFLTFCQLECVAQNYPVYNSYCVNPYLYNPAEAATDFTYVFINHRRQFVGVEGAPVLTTFNINSQLNNSRAGLGTKISSFQRGILNTTDISLTYAYGIPTSKTNVLHFGFSGGAVNSNVNTSKLTSNVDLSDPLLKDSLGMTFQPTANFGMLYRTNTGLNFGIILPQLFAPTYIAKTFSGTQFTPIDNVVITAYYRRKVEGKIVTQKKKGVRAKVKTADTNAPLEIYAMYKYSKFGTSQFEVIGKFNLGENFWLGAMYRQSYGFAALTGIQAKQFMLSYSYELGGQPEAGFSSGSHEIQIGLRLGQQKKFRRPTPVLHSLLKTPNAQHVARFQQTIEDTDQIQSKDEDKKKYFVVIKAFSDFTGADVFKKKLVIEKYNADIFYYEKDKKYYVHVLETGKSSEAYEEARNLKNYTKLKDAKVLTVVTPK